MVKKEYMDKFKKLKLYALKKKTHQIDKHNGHYTNSMRDIQNFIEGVKGRSIIGLKFERISTTRKKAAGSRGAGEPLIF